MRWVGMHVCEVFKVCICMFTCVYLRCICVVCV